MVPVVRMTARELARLRLAAQRIAGPGMATVAEAAGWLTAMQAQDQYGILTSVALRTAAGTRDGVLAAFDTGEIVKSWPMRGTLHVVPAGDLPWMLRVTAPRVVRTAATRHAALGLDAAMLDRARELTVSALSGGRRLRRDDLFAAWNAGGVATDGQRAYHTLWHLAQTGTVCFGPTCGGDQLLVLVDEWIGSPRRPDRDEALGELASRYFRGHGPATVADFTRWTGLVAADVRTALAIAGPGLARLELDGTEYLMDERTPDLLDACRPDARGVFLLPGFDEYVIGYGDRGAMLPAEFAQRIVPGGNGVFRPTVVADGQVVGTWRAAGRGAARTVEATPFTSFTDRVARAIPRVYARLP